MLVDVCGRGLQELLTHHRRLTGATLGDQQSPGAISEHNRPGWQVMHLHHVRRHARLSTAPL